MFKKFKDYFFVGVAVLLPSILTIWVFVQCYGFVHENISTSINRNLVRLLVLSTDDYPFPTEEDVRHYALSQDESLAVDPERLQAAMNDPKFYDGARVKVAEKFWVYGKGQITGFLIALIGVAFFGAFLASVLGRALWKRFEQFLLKTPIFRKVYPYVKQITDFFLTQNKLSFTRVVAIQYPRKGLWSIALVTGEGLKEISSLQKLEHLTVFVPSSPTPFTGYVITIPKDEAVMLDMSIEEALRFTISGGVITPTQQKLYEQQKAEKSLGS